MFKNKKNNFIFLIIPIFILIIILAPPVKAEDTTGCCGTENGIGLGITWRTLTKEKCDAYGNSDPDNKYKPDFDTSKKASDDGKSCIDKVSEPPKPSKITAPILSVSIPGFSKFSDVNCSDPNQPCQIPWLAEYIQALYKYSITLIGILAVIVMMIGGVLWLTAGGNRERISSAMGFIKSGILGTILALCSYALLVILSPNLVVLSPINISYIAKKDFDPEDLTPEEQISAEKISGPIGSTTFGEGTNGVPLVMQCRGQVRSVPYGAKNNKTGCGKTICSSGCGVASLSMVIFYFKKDTDFNNVVSNVYKNGGRNGCSGGTANPSIETTAKGYGLKATRDTSGFDWAAEKAKTCPVVISVHEVGGGCPFTKHAHYIVITGNNNGILSINDPMHGGATISLSDMKRKCGYGTGATQICQ